MANFIRRAGAELLRLLSSVAAPSADSTAIQWWAQTIAGVVQLFQQDSDGLIYQTTPSLSLASRMAYWGEDVANNTSITSANTGASASTAVTTTSTGHPGIARQQTGTTNTGRTFYTVTTTITGGTLNCVVLLGGGQITHECCCRTNNAQNGTEQWIDRFGMGDTLTGDQANGVYFEGDRATYGDNNYRICTASGGTRTKNTTSNAPTSAFDRWRFVVDTGATSVQAYLNDSAVGSAVSSNLPTAGLAIYFGSLEKTLGTTSRTVDRDYIETFKVLNR